MTSGIESLTFASLAPAAVVSGLLVKATTRYRPQMWIGWILSITAFGLLSTLLATDALGKSTGYLVLLGLGIGYVMFVGCGLGLMRQLAPIAVRCTQHRCILFKHPYR